MEYNINWVQNLSRELGLDLPDLTDASSTLKIVVQQCMPEQWLIEEKLPV